MVSLRAHLVGTAGCIQTTARIGFLISWGFISWPALARAIDTNAVLNAWFAAQTNLHTWKADFTQTRFIKSLRQPLVTSGQAWFKPPNRYRWELGAPVQTIALRQADELLVVYPLLKRVERYPTGDKMSGQWRDALTLLEAGFPRDRVQLESRFRLSSVAVANGVRTLTLQPKSASARRMMKEIRLGLMTNDFSLLSTELVFVDGSKMRNDFTNTVLNSTIDAKLFDWTPPADFKVTEPLAK